MARSVLGPRFTGYGWARTWVMGENMGENVFFLGIQTRRLAPNARSVEYVLAEDAGACEFLVARSVLGPRFAVYGWARTWVMGENMGAN